MSTIDTPTCSTCMEKFHGMKVNGQSECLCCARDKNVPKLYSLDNNVHSGHIPPNYRSVLTLSPPSFYSNFELSLYLFLYQLLTNVPSNHIYPSSTLNKEYFYKSMVT